MCHRWEMGWVRASRFRFDERISMKSLRQGCNGTGGGGVMATCSPRIAILVRLREGECPGRLGLMSGLELVECQRPQPRRRPLQTENRGEVESVYQLGCVNTCCQSLASVQSADPSIPKVFSSLWRSNTRMVFAPCSVALVQTALHYTLHFQPVRESRAEV